MPAGVETGHKRPYAIGMFPRQDSEVQLSRLVFGAALIATFVGLYPIAQFVLGDGGPGGAILGFALSFGSICALYAWWHRHH